MTIEEIANGLVDLCRQGKYLEAIDAYYHDDILSIEPVGGEAMPAEMRGKETVRKKSEWWIENNEVHSSEIEGPMIGGNQFSMLLTSDVTFKPENRRQTLKEMCLYTVENGKIVKERFYYHMPGM